MPFLRWNIKFFSANEVTTCHITNLSHDRVPFQLLELPEQHQPRHHVRRNDVQVAEEVAQQAGNIGERVPAAVTVPHAAKQQPAPMIPAVLVRSDHLPLAPIPTPAAASFVVEAGLRFPHRPLVLFHLNPGPAGWVKRAPDCGDHAEYHQQITDDDRHDGLFGLLDGTLEVVVLEPHDAQT